MLTDSPEEELTAHEHELGEDDGVRQCWPLTIAELRPSGGIKSVVKKHQNGGRRILFFCACLELVKKKME